MASKRSKKAPVGGPKTDKRRRPKAPAQNGEHVGEIEVQAAERTPEAPQVRLVEIVKAQVSEPGVPDELPDEAVRQAAAVEADDGPDGDRGGDDFVDREEEPPVGTAPGPANGDPDHEQLADVMAHLLFHQALIRDADAGADIERYLELAKDIRQGVHVVLDNPFDKSIAIVFELVMEERMNPWDIDLRQFSSLYLSRVRGQSAVDFIAAGKLMLMAWSILKAQTDEVISAIQRIEARRREEEEAALDPGLADGAPFGDDAAWMSADETTYNFTRAVIEADPLHLSEAVHPPSERPVSLYDLIHAFEEAKEEGATRMILEEERAKARAELERTRKANVSGMMHNENLEEEIAATWTRILERAHEEESPSTPLSLDSLHNGTRDDYLTVFISALFLAYNQRIVLKQQDLPRGPIMLQLTPEAQKGNLPPMPAPVVVAPPVPKARPRSSKRKAKRGSDGAKGSRQAPSSR